MHCKNINITDMKFNMEYSRKEVHLDELIMLEPNLKSYDKYTYNLESSNPFLH